MSTSALASSSSIDEVDFELAGWELFVAELERVGDEGGGLAELRTAVAQRARQRFRLETLGSEPVAAALRELFKAAGCAPSRYRPSSEALLRRLLKGEDLPAIDALVDLGNALSAELAVPCCIRHAGASDGL